MTQVVLHIPERTTPATSERIEIQLGRCLLESCQTLFVPDSRGKAFCCDEHRYTFRDQRKKERS